MGDPNAGQRVPIFVSLSRQLHLPPLPVLSSNTLIMMHYTSSAIPVYFSRVTFGSCNEYLIFIYMGVLRRGTFSCPDLFGPTWIR